MYKKAIWLAFSFISLMNVVLPNPSFSSSNNKIGPEPESKSNLSPYDKRGGYVCPNGKAFAWQLDAPREGLPSYDPFLKRTVTPTHTEKVNTSEASYRLGGYIEKYNVVKKDKSWIMELKPAFDNVFEDGPKLEKFGLNIKLLVGKSQVSYSKEQLQLIFDKYKFQRDLPSIGYDFFELIYSVPPGEKTDDERMEWIARSDRGLSPERFRMKNSAGKQLTLSRWDYNSVGSIVAGGKGFIPNREINTKGLSSHILSCTGEGNLQVRSIYMLNDRGDNPGETLEYPAMVLVVDVFIYDSLKVKNQPDVTF